MTGMKSQNIFYQLNKSTAMMFEQGIIVKIIKTNLTSPNFC
jgi:hypothetical protein